MMTTGSPVQRTLSRVEEPPMYLQRPSSGRSQSVSHVLSKTFRDVLGKDMIGPDTIHNLTISKGSPDEYHERYVSALQKVDERRTKKASEIGAVERHIMQAQAKATSADEREINRIGNTCQGYSDMGLPPAHSHFRAVVNQSLLSRHNLIAPDDYVTTFLPLVPPPPVPSEPNYTRETTASTRRRSGRESSAPSEVSGILDYDLHLHSDCSSQESLVITPRKQKYGKQENNMWKAHMTVEQRYDDRKSLANIETRSNFLRNPRFEAVKEGAVFLPKPKQIVFNDYQIGHVYELSLELRNLSPCLQNLRVLPPKSGYFSMGLGQFPSDGGVVAAGLSCVYRIRFIPDSLSDYDDSVTVHTKSGDLIVPVLARREPPKLSIPEVLDAGHCLVGGCRTVQFMITNTGGRGSFCIMPRESWPASNFKSVIKPSGVDVDPFFVTPSVIELNEHQSTIIQVSFRPPSVKSYTRSLTFVCDNCHIQHLTLTGEGQLADVQFIDVEGGLSDYQLGELPDVSATRLVRFDNLHPFTFTQKRLQVKNMTKVQLPYSWKLVKPHILCPKEGDYNEETNTTEIKDENQPKVRVVDPDSVFSVEPQSGLLEPDSEIEATLTFAPPMVGDFHRVLHMVLHQIPETGGETDSDVEPPLLDVACLEIELKGDSRPLHVTVEPYGVFVSGQILVGTTIRKPIQLTNHSLTPVVYQWEPITSGPIIEVELPIGEIGPSASETLYVSITGAEPGKIKETLKCLVENLEEPIYLFVEADVKGPEVVVDEPDINFGLIRLGQIASMNITLQNLSNMSARWSVHESAAAASQDNAMAESELIFFPSCGELRPLESRTVEVRFKPAMCRSVKTFVELLVEEGNECNLLVLAEVQTPRVCLLSCQLSLEDIYHRVKKCNIVKLYNQTMLPTSFKWLEVEGSQSSECTVVMEPSFGYLGPREERDVTVNFTAHAQQEYNDVRVGCQIEGMEENFYLNIMAEVKGLDVSYEALDIDGSVRTDLSLELGESKLLEPVSRTLILRNNSAIISNFRFCVKQFPARPPTPPRVSAAPVVKTGRKCLLNRRANLADPTSKTAAKAIVEVCQLMLRSGRGVAFSAEPATGQLSAFSEQRITITGYSDMWGQYTDTIIAEVDSLQPVHIPVTLSAIGCPLSFQIASSNQKAPCLRFGTHVFGVKSTTRPVRINNSSPFDVRVDWETYNVLDDDKKLLDLVVTYGRQFPLKDDDEEEIVPEYDTDVPLERRPTMADSPFTTPCYSLVSRTQTNMTNNSCSYNHPKVITLKLRAHEGRRCEEPYSVTRTQVFTLLCWEATAFQLMTDEIDIGVDHVPDVEGLVILLDNLGIHVIPAKHHNTVNFVFTPPQMKSLDSEEDCSSFALGHLSIESQARESPCITRKDGLNVEPLRVDMFAHIKPAKLTIEFDDDDENGEMMFMSALGDLLQSGQISSESIRSSHCLLHNLTAARLTFSLTTNDPFLLLNPAPPSGIHGEQLVENITLNPKQTLAVDIGFSVKLEMLETIHRLPEGEEVNNVKWTTSTSGERHLHYQSQFDIKFNNKTQQTIPLRASVAMPAFTLSDDVIDFGTCFVNEERQMELVISNTTSSNAHWRLDIDDIEDKENRDAFTVAPSNGELEAYVTHSSKSKSLIRVSFIASSNVAYERVFILRGHLGEEEKRLVIRGQGSFDGCHELMRA